MDFKQVTAPREPVIVPGAIIMPYKYFAGACASKFFIELRDNKRIMGIRCPLCNRVYVPPCSTCACCFSKLDEWVEVDKRGTVTSYAMVNYHLPVHPVEAPFFYGIIQLDGADTGLVHFLGEVGLEEVRIGMRVEAVFKQQGEGNILDIKYFKPLK